MCLRDNLRVIDIEIGLRDIADGDDAFKGVPFRDDWKGDDIALVHDGPCLLEGHVFIYPGCLTVLDIGDLGLYGGDQPWFRNLEVIEDEGGLTGWLAGAARDVLTAAGDFIFQVCVCDRSADGVGIRVSMARDQHLTLRVVWDQCFIFRHVFSSQIKLSFLIIRYHKCGGNSMQVLEKGHGR